MNETLTLKVKDQEKIIKAKESQWLKRKIRIYVSGPYSLNKTYKKNVEEAISTGMNFIKRGFVVIIPHLHHFIDKQFPQTMSNDQWINYDLDVLLMTDCLYLFGEWNKSEGCRKEIEYAQSHFIPVLKNEKELELFVEYWNK